MAQGAGLSRGRNLDAQGVVDLTPQGHPDKPTRLNDFGTSITCLKCLGELSDNEDAVLTFRDAIDLTPHGHACKPARLDNLGTAFVARFECLEELSDIDEAIWRREDAANLTPGDYADKPGRLGECAQADPRNV